MRIRLEVFLQVSLALCYVTVNWIRTLLRKNHIETSRRYLYLSSLLSKTLRDTVQRITFRFFIADTAEHTAEMKPQFPVLLLSATNHALRLTINSEIILLIKDLAYLNLNMFFTCQIKTRAYSLCCVTSCKCCYSDISVGSNKNDLLKNQTKLLFNECKTKFKTAGNRYTTTSPT